MIPHQRGDHTESDDPDDVHVNGTDRGQRAVQRERERSDKVQHQTGGSVATARVYRITHRAASGPVAVAVSVCWPRSHRQGGLARDRGEHTDPRVGEGGRDRAAPLWTARAADCVDPERSRGALAGSGRFAPPGSVCASRVVTRRARGSWCTDVMALPDGPGQVAGVERPRGPGRGRRPTSRPGPPGNHRAQPGHRTGRAASHTRPRGRRLGADPAEVADDGAGLDHRARAEVAAVDHRARPDDHVVLDDRARCRAAGAAPCSPGSAPGRRSAPVRGCRR